MKKGIEKVYPGTGFTIYLQNLPRKQLENHIQDEAHLFIPLEDLEVEVKGTIYKVNSGKMMFISGELDHSFSSSSVAGSRIILKFDESLNKKFKAQKNKAVSLPTHPLLKDLILSLFPFSQSSFAPGMEHLILEILLENLTLQSMNSDNLMFRTQEKIFTASQSDIKKITTLMEAEMDLSVEEISNRVAISKRTLTRIIQSRDRSIA